MKQRFVPSASFKFEGFFLFFVLFVFKQSHLMGIHQLPKAHPQRTIQSAVMILQLFPTCNSTVPFMYFLKFLESFAYYVPLSASLRTGFSQNKNAVFQPTYSYCMKGLFCFHFLQSSLMQSEVWMSQAQNSNN